MATLGMPLLGMGQETPTLTSLLTARREREKQSKLADLLANAYGTQDQAQRQQYVQEAIRTDPQAGMGLAKLLDPRLSGSGGKPAQQQYAEWLLSQAPADQRDQVLGVLAGYKARPSGAAITYKDGEDEFGNPIIRAFDPNNVGGTVLGTGQSYGAPVGTGMRGGGQQQPMQAPDKAAMEADIALANQLAQAGFDPDKIDAFLNSRGRMAQQAAPQAIPQPSGGFMGRRKEAEQAAVTAAQEAVKLQYLPAQEQIKAQAAIDQARGVEQAKAGVERDAQAPKRREKFRLVQTGIQNTIDAIDGAIGKVNWATSGPIGAATKGIPGTPAYALAKAASTVKANIGFDRLQQMRDASPTGGALGQVAVQELEGLQASIASLDQGLPPDELEANLKTVRRHYQNWLNAVKQAEQADIGGQQPQRPAASGVPKPGTVEGGYRFKGGNPADPNAWERI